MEMDVTIDRKNPLMERRDVELFLAHEGLTPSKKELTSAIATKLKVKETQVVVNHVYQSTGRLDAKILAKVYDKPVREEEKKVEAKAEEAGAEAKKEDSDAKESETKEE